VFGNSALPSLASDVDVALLLKQQQKQSCGLLAFFFFSFPSFLIQTSAARREQALLRDGVLEPLT